MKKLLITGFMPFGGDDINPSWEAVLRLPDSIHGYELTKLLVPVEFKTAPDLVIDEAAKISPDAVLCIGQAAGRDAVTPELVGINLRYAKIPDNAGKEPKDEKICEGGADALFSTIPVRKIAEAIEAAGIPSSVSYSAGAYVCNDLLYSLLSHFEKSAVRVGFIHVPRCPEQGESPSMEISDMVKAICIAIENL